MIIRFCNQTYFNHKNYLMKHHYHYGEKHDKHEIKKRIFLYSE